MTATVPFSTHHVWVLADTSRSALEVLGIIAAVVGMLLWVAGLAWLVLSDVFRAIHHSHTRDEVDAGHDSDRSAH